jgi:hypothetical protein
MSQAVTELGKLNHIGIAVPGPRHDAVVKSVVALFAGEVLQSGDDDDLDARWSWVRASSGLVIEVVSPLGVEGTALHRFLARTGGGLHHVSFDAADIGACRTAAHDRGLPLLGANDDHAGWAEFFVDPKQTGGALFHWMKPVTNETRGLLAAVQGRP